MVELLSKLLIKDYKNTSDGDVRRAYGTLVSVLGLILNVILFVPLGFLLPVLWQNFRRMGACGAFGLGLSLAIELMQMLTFRATDVNDLITNTAGTLLGFLLAKGLTPRISAAGEGRREALCLTALSFSVMFFIHPFLSPLIWDRIL